MLAQEIATLRKEAQAFKAVRAALRTPSNDNNDAVKMVFQKACYFFTNFTSWGSRTYTVVILRYTSLISGICSPWRICGDHGPSQHLLTSMAYNKGPSACLSRRRRSQMALPTGHLPTHRQLLQEEAPLRRSCSMAPHQARAPGLRTKGH